MRARNMREAAGGRDDGRSRPALGARPRMSDIEADTLTGTLAGGGSKPGPGGGYWAGAAAAAVVGLGAAAWEP